jgi:hypothetical protein
MTMITFQEMLDGVQRVAEMLRAAEELQTALEDGLEGMDDLVSMMAFSHEKEFQSVEMALDYIDQVLMPQLRGLRDSLTTSTEDQLRRLRIASASAERLAIRLQMLGDGGVENFLS